MPQYLRFHLWKKLLKPISYFSRKNRTKIFVKKLLMPLIEAKQNIKILDVGGHPDIWEYVDQPLNIVCLNLPGNIVRSSNTHHTITYVEGDGCHMPQYKINEFDLIFSNSVIEHVGDMKQRKMFANEIKRVSKNYWIQTPCKYFPIEAHTGMPFWWFYPKFVRSFFITRWNKKLPAWTKMIQETDFVTKKELQKLFPDAKIETEWLIFPKSIIVYNLEI